ncbi:MAG TPA: glucokinase [Burkholderiales bacterium]|nr:glucokinase [Burkholderiales bacterium]
MAAHLLAADIGGTKTDLGIYALGSGPRAPIATGRLSSTAYNGIEPLVRAFLDERRLAVDYACFDVAGPVVGGRATLTNLPWTLDEAALSRALGVKAVWLLNDLVATATAVPCLLAEDLVTLNAGHPVHGGTIAVIAPGTGLGEAFLTWDGERYRAYASEGGHASFGPSAPAEVELYIYVRQRFGHVSYERVCSGIGMPNLYRFHRDSAHATESPAIAARLAQAADHEKAHAIIDGALDPKGPDPLCAAALDTFVAILGTETANLMLKTLSTGGLYMAGGIAARILPVLRTGALLARVLDKGRMSELLARIPIHVVTAPQTALLGAASHGLECIRALSRRGEGSSIEAPS